MTIEGNAEGCLLGLACGDALGRPVEFKSAEEIASQHGEVTEMLGNGTHGQPPGTITDDTEMALCIAESLTDRRGFDPGDVAERFVDWLASGPFDIGLMTQDSLSRIRGGTPWADAGVEVWEGRPEGSNAGNGSVMRCAPYAIAFRHFEDELSHVSRVSSAITHADPRCQWGCVILNRTLANLIRDVDDPLETALSWTRSVPEELRTALTDVQEVLDGEREPAEIEAQLTTTGYVVDSLQAGLFYGLTADSFEWAIVEAVNRGDDTDTVGAIAGAVAGARFGSAAIPDRWTDAIDEANRLERLAERLLKIRSEVPGKEALSLGDGMLVFKQRSIIGPAYIPVSELAEHNDERRSRPAPHQTVGTEYHELTPETAAMVDWERRAYAVRSGQQDSFAASTIDLGEESSSPESAVVPMPQYPIVESFGDLLEADQRRIKLDGREAAEAFVRAYTAFARIRHPITELETTDVGIERRDPIAGTTRELLIMFADMGKALLVNTVNSYESPEDIRNTYRLSRAKKRVAETPNAVYRANELYDDLLSEAAAILDYLTQLPRSETTQQTSLESANDVQIEDLCEAAQEMVGALHVMRESLRRVAVRHPEIDYELWLEMNARDGGR